MTLPAHCELTFHPLPKGGRIATLRLNHPDVANAFSVQMMNEIHSHMNLLKSSPDIRAVVLCSRGKHFSAGADLNWMKSSALLTFEENIQDANQLKAMFESVSNLRVPKIAVVQGATYGGAVGLVACCDYVIAHENSRFCLSEAKLGLIPAVILPYLGRKISFGPLKRACLTSYVISSAEAKAIGLVEIVTDQLEERLSEELNLILSGAPQAQSMILKLIDEELQPSGFRQGDHTVRAIAKARTGVEGQKGVQSFFDKTSAPWLDTFKGPLLSNEPATTGHHD